MGGAGVGVKPKPEPPSNFSFVPILKKAGKDDGSVSATLALAIIIVSCDQVEATKSQIFLTPVNVKGNLTVKALAVTLEPIMF